jgi:SAM-dependent methyltransferase
VSAVAPVDTAAGKPSILANRTLANSHPTLLGLLAPNRSVLDVGCGPGGLTAEIAARVRPGHVVGMDLAPEVIRAAEAAYPPADVPNLVFYVGDVRESGWDAEFDVVNAARVLQWMPDPEVAVARMARAVRVGGAVVLLDAEHTRAEWRRAPAAWTRFHDAFLAWRRAAGLDNAIATRLGALCRAAGLGDVAVRPRVTTVHPGDPDFFRVAGHWRMLIESRGRRMVAAGHLGEDERRAAQAAYTAWMQRADAVHVVHEACAVARRLAP